MKIALIADPELPVPPLLYGGIERIIDMLIEGYINLGHQVSLFAHPASVTKAKLYPYKGKTSTNKIDIIKNTLLINRILFNEKFDVVHSFGRLLYLFPNLPFSIPKLMSYQREPTIDQIKKVMLLARKNTMTFTGCSNYISNQILPYAPAYAIYNGVDISKYEFQATVAEDAPLIFLGRIEPTKGTHVAIEVAKKSNKKLIIAGNIPKEFESYFEKEIKPHLNEQIKYIGSVNDVEKNELMGIGLAFLMPILWNEPFGIVMAEAMACGTPVIGFSRGSVPEVVIDGINGFTCTNTTEMIDLVLRIGEIDREKVRLDAEKRFSAEVIVNEYLMLYNKLIMNN